MASAGLRPGLRRATLDLGARTALREAGRALAWSRALCWVAGIGAVLALGAHTTFDPLHLTTPFGGLADTLVAPAARWDSTWYLQIANHGYATRQATAFYPLYPLSARIVGTPLGSSLIGGIVVSVAALLAALYLLRRLVERELGGEPAKRTVLLVAFFPTAVYFSAVYSEGLLLALTVGAFYAARRGRWAYAGIAGGLATMTHPDGALVIVPLVLLHLYGPRDDRPEPIVKRGLRPRYPLTRSVLWLALAPAGGLLYATYLAVKFRDPLVALGAAKTSGWDRTFTFPLRTVWHATRLAARDVPQIFHGQPPPRSVYELAFLGFMCVGAAGAFRRLPVAYGAYALAGIAFVTSFPVGGVSLSDSPRLLAIFFPAVIWWASWSSERRLFKGLLAVCAVLMVWTSARFGAWHWAS